MHTSDSPENKRRDWGFRAAITRVQHLIITHLHLFHAAFVYELLENRGSSVTDDRLVNSCFRKLSCDPGHQILT